MCCFPVQLQAAQAAAILCNEGHEEGNESNAANAGHEDEQ